MRPLATEKAVMKIEAENVLTFLVDKRMSRDEIKKQVEEMFKVKVERVRTLIRENKKLAYVKLNKKDLAIDVATKLGMM
jgi:large subunit ribosomal protein L23